MLCKISFLATRGRNHFNSHFPNFLVECTQNSDCNGMNKGICDTGSNECKCNAGFVADGNKCVGMLPFKKDINKICYLNHKCLLKID